MALVYKHEKMDNGWPGRAAVSADQASGLNEADGKYDEVGIWTQMSF